MINVLIASVAREYLEIFETLWYGRAATMNEVYQLENQRVALHQQLTEWLGYHPTIEQIRTLVLQGQAEALYDDQR